MVSFCIPVYNIDAGVVGTVVVLEAAVPMVAIEDINLILSLYEDNQLFKYMHKL